MKARKLIEGATYGPETLKVIGNAFDDAWSEIGSQFDGLQAQSARLKLALAVLSAAREDSRDPDELKNAALQVMAMPIAISQTPLGQSQPRQRALLLGKATRCRTTTVDLHEMVGVLTGRSPRSWSVTRPWSWPC